MNRITRSTLLVVALAHAVPAVAQSEFQPLLCEAARSSQRVEMVYDKDVSKECLPRMIDVHQVGIGNDGRLYMHGWQTRGCTAGRDKPSLRIYRFDKIESLRVIEGTFSDESQSLKAEGWNGCIGTNCIIRENICE